VVEAVVAKAAPGEKMKIYRVRWLQAGTALVKTVQRIIGELEVGM
jgi:hypothetical protein